MTDPPDDPGHDLADDPAERLALHLDGFDGPLDLLLDLARRQKLDLARISILDLVDQYLAVIEGARRVRLELAADWLVMAAWLAWLKSRRLLPVEERGGDGGDGEQPGDLLALRLQALEGIRRAAAWLGQRPRLGEDVFVRGQPEDLREIDRSRLLADTPGLVRAYLAATTRAAGRRRYTPGAPASWTVQDALERLRRLLGILPDWSTLERFLPPLAVASPLARRAAHASTLLAGLELARTGALGLRQDAPFGPIQVGPIQVGPPS